MGPGVLFYFQTNKRPPHMHVLVLLGFRLSCLKGGAEEKSKQLVWELWSRILIQGQASEATTDKTE